MATTPGPWHKRATFNKDGEVLSWLIGPKVDGDDGIQVMAVVVGQEDDATLVAEAPTLLSVMHEIAAHTRATSAAGKLARGAVAKFRD